MPYELRSALRNHRYLQRRASARRLRLAIAVDCVIANKIFHCTTQSWRLWLRRDLQVLRASEMREPARRARILELLIVTSAI
jgi:hypothetical protein